MATTTHLQRPKKLAGKQLRLCEFGRSCCLVLFNLRMHRAASCVGIEHRGVLPPKPVRAAQCHRHRIAHSSYHVVFCGVKPRRVVRHHGGLLGKPRVHVSHGSVHSPATVAKRRIDQPARVSPVALQDTCEATAAVELALNACAGCLCLSPPRHWCNQRLHRPPNAFHDSRDPPVCLPQRWVPAASHTSHHHGVGLRLDTRVTLGDV